MLGHNRISRFASLERCPQNQVLFRFAIRSWGETGPHLACGGFWRWLRQLHVKSIGRFTTAWQLALEHLQMNGNRCAA